MPTDKRQAEEDMETDSKVLLHFTRACKDPQETAQVKNIEENLNKWRDSHLCNPILMMEDNTVRTISSSQFDLLVNGIPILNASNYLWC